MNNNYKLVTEKIRNRSNLSTIANKFLGNNNTFGGNNNSIGGYNNQLGDIYNCLGNMSNANDNIITKNNRTGGNIGINSDIRTQSKH